MCVGLFRSMGVCVGVLFVVLGAGQGQTTPTASSWPQLKAQVQHEQDRIERLAALVDGLNRSVQQLLHESGVSSYPPWDCGEARHTDPSSGPHWLRTSNKVQAYCDQDTDGGNWTVIQRRIDGSIDFFRNWTDYEGGFGYPDGEFWLGLRPVHLLTTRGDYSLRIDMRDSAGRTSHATYGHFVLTGPEDGYKKRTSDFSGNASDSFKDTESRFSTHDRDNDDRVDVHCAALYHTGWWLSACGFSNLNGPYQSPEGQAALNFTVWDINRLVGSPATYLTWTEMKIRPAAGK